MQTNPNLPPVFDAVLSSITGTQETIQRCTTYFPNVGVRRPYRSLGDAMSYESGYMAYDRTKAAPTWRTPFADGWADAAARESGAVAQ